jgi:hypothetical protein
VQGSGYVALNTVAYRGYVLRGCSAHIAVLVLSLQQLVLLLAGYVASVRLNYQLNSEVLDGRSISERFSDLGVGDSIVDRQRIVS